MNLEQFIWQASILLLFQIYIKRITIVRCLPHRMQWIRDATSRRLVFYSSSERADGIETWQFESSGSVIDRLMRNVDGERCCVTVMTQSVDACRTRTTTRRCASRVNEPMLRLYSDSISCVDSIRGLALKQRKQL